MKRKPQQAQKIARGRVDHLLEQALRMPENANRYAQLATKILQKLKLKKTPEQKMRICKKCSSYLVPGDTLRVRMTQGKLSLTCTVCGHIRRMPYVREQKSRRERTRTS